MPFENDKYDMLVTWNTICDQVNKGEYAKYTKVTNRLFALRKLKK